MLENSDKKCDHQIKDRSYETKMINGVKLNVEICNKCKQMLIKPEDAQKYLSNKGGKNKPLDPNEVIIALLGTYPDRPVINRIVMMKEAFLLEKEVAKDIKLNIESLKFIPYDFGPYSKLIDNALRELKDDGIIQIDHEAGGQKEIIKLTEKGKEIAKKLFKLISEDHIKYLKRKRKGWDQLGYYGILRKVYEDYPAYRTKSKIKDKIQPSRRWV